jgi:hypothetical protein
MQSPAVLQTRKSRRLRTAVRATFAAALTIISAIAAFGIAGESMPHDYVAAPAHVRMPLQPVHVANARAAVP